MSDSKVNICSDCHERCGVALEDQNIDDGFGTQEHEPIEVSDCHDAEINELDEDLVEWHEALSRLAEKRDAKWMVNPDPETYREMFEEGKPESAELEDLMELYNS